MVNCTELWQLLSKETLHRRSHIRPHATTGLSKHCPQASISTSSGYLSCYGYIMLGSSKCGSKHNLKPAHAQFLLYNCYTSMRVNCTCQISTHNFRSALNTDVVGGAFCPNQVNYMLQFDWLLLPSPFKLQTAVWESQTQLTTSVYLLFGDLYVKNSCSYLVYIT